MARAPRTRRRLATYRRKRDFELTPEPPPQRRPRRGHAPIYVLQEHAARAHHYDFRLEIDGALASWAVPKGPSFDPTVRRLAVEVEDHPLEYASFEGTIPEGQYGAGIAVIRDRGTFQTDPPGQASSQRAKGHLVIELKGKLLSGRWHLVRTRSLSKKPSWLMFRGRGK